MKDSMQDFIDRYVRGEMSAEERVAFEKQLREDNELKEMFEFTLSVSDAIKDRKEKLEKIKRWNAEDVTSRKSVKFYQTLGGKIVYGFLSAVAVVAIVLYFNHCPSMPELNAQSYECYRGGSEINKIAELINDKRYVDAMDKILPMEENYAGERDSIKRLMPEASSENVERLDYELSANLADSQELQWLKVYAYIGLKQYKEARQLLKHISTTPGVYMEKADSLLDEF